MLDYWRDTVLCPRKGFCHISHGQCLETHDIRLCRSCPHFQKILEWQEYHDLEEIEKREERLRLAPRRRGREKKK